MTVEVFALIAFFIFIAFGVAVYLFITKSEEMKKKELLKVLQRIQKALNVVVDKVNNGPDEYDECMSMYTDRIISDLERIFCIADTLVKHNRFRDLVKDTAEK